jgi:ABC-type multidrug transport system fused ATPase/permease subunit
MADLSPSQLSFLFRQEWLIVFALQMVFFGMYTMLVAFLVYFFRKDIISMHYAHISPCSRTCIQSDHLTHIPGTSSTDQKSPNILLFLILLMYLIEILHNVLQFYKVWLAFIQNGDSAEHVFITLRAPEPTKINIAIETMTTLLVTLRLLVADSIMVSPNCFHYLICELNKVLIRFGAVGLFARSVGRSSSSR